ncbi:MAG: DEAD/DEAH box helicase [Quadrisphaera sp.]
MSSAPTGTSSDHSSAPSSDRSADRSTDRGVDEAPASSTRFADLGLGPELLAALNDLGYEEPTPVQAEAVPYLLAGRDLLGQAATGTGKTAAFALPLLQRLADASRSGEPAGKGPSALVLAPTRELALQVASATESYGTGLGVRVLAVYGGAPIGGQLRELQRGVDVVVGTPGRVLDHLSRGSLDLSGVRTVVLDEADEMLDAGFQDEIEGILQQAPRERQTVLFSATMAGRIERIARTHQTDPVRVVLQRGGPRGWRAPGRAARARGAAGVEAAGAAPRARRGGTRRRDHLLPQPRRGRRAHRVPQRPRHARRGAARRHEPGPARQGHGAPARRGSRSCWWPPMSPPAASTWSSSRTSSTTTCPPPPRRTCTASAAWAAAGAPAWPSPSPSRARPGTSAGWSAPRAGSIAVVPVPTAETLRERRAERTAAALEAADVDGAARELAAKLTAERDPSEVLAAALVLLAQARGEKADEPDVPDASSGRPLRSGPRAGAERSARPIGGARGEGRRAPHGRDAGPARGGRKPRIGGEVSRVWVGLGRQAGVRPQDLVGAVTGETRLDGGEVGAIEVHERYSIVEVPSGAVDDVVTGLQSGLIRGRKVRVRPERF